MAALKSGSQIGSYEILAPLGAGGMGEVYRSRDTKLKREVAIKVLPAEFSSDPDRIQRFQREAEVLATLNHPHIAQIYGLEESAGSLCLILELVEGETLAERIKRGPIPLDETLEIARQIAEALEAAHERDIVHRDLKPANIKLTHDGKVKVLDFGLAKALAADASDAAMSRSPTLVTGTIPGMILGTAQYMSPEQAKGRAADGRSDIWAFGCVLFEMLTGKPTFAGDSVVEILGGILRADPDWAELPDSTPPAIRSLLKRCLQRDRTRRLRDIADARFQIEDALGAPPAGVALVPRSASLFRERAMWLVAIFLTLVVATIIYFRTPADAPAMRLQIETPPGTSLSWFAISPDGQKLVFRAITSGKVQLWLRPIGAETAQPLAGTEDAISPFWSPDSRSIGFYSAGQLKRLDLDGGLVRSLTTVRGAVGGAWTSDDSIIFGRVFSGPLYRIDAKGGEIAQVTSLDPPRVTGHIFPSILPGGRHYLFFGYGPAESRGIYVGSADTKQTERIIEADSTAVFVPPDLVLFGRNDTLQAQRLDLKTFKPIGDPMLVSQKLAVNLDVVQSAVSASANVIAYRSADVERRLVWLDRTGREVGVVGAQSADLKIFDGTRLSLDDQTAAIISTASGTLSVWLTETSTGISRRFSLGKSWHCCPVWSPDGNRLLFSSDPGGVSVIYEKAIDESGADIPLLELPNETFPLDWSSDGRYILYREQSAQTNTDLWILPRGEKKPMVIAQTAAEETFARFSPDSRWIAYQSNETGTSEIWVQRFPGGAGRRQVTTGGGTRPAWNRNGRELFYMGPDNRLMAMPVTLTPTTFEARPAIPLFTLPADSLYDVSRSGEKFLVNKIVKDAAPITLILNWKPPSN